MMSHLQVGLGLRPGFGQQPDAGPETTFEQQPPEPVDAVADHADGARGTGPRVTMIGSQRLGRRPQVAWGDACGPGRLPLGCRRPEPAGWPPTTPASGGRHGSGRCGGSCPTSQPQTLEGLEAQFDPEAERVPAGSHLVGGEIGEDDPGFFLLGVPDHQQGATALGLGSAEGGAATDPGRVGSGDEALGPAIVCRRQRRK